MPRLRCPCGFVHNLSAIPDDGWIVVRDKDYQAVVDAHILEHAVATSGTEPQKHPQYAAWQAATLTIVNAWRRLYECPECRRLMWARDGKHQWEIFVPEPNNRERATSS